MARINVTGFTGAQARGSNRRNVLSLHNLIIPMLKDAGHEAGRDLENPDLNIVFVLDPSSINASNTVKCLELLSKENCIIAFDDWQIRGFYKTIDNIANHRKFSKTHHTVSYDGLMDNLDTIKKLSNGEFKAIFPAYKTGDHDLLEIRGEKHALDPSIYVERERPFETEVSTYQHHLLAVHASLATKWKDLDKKKYSILNVRNETEDNVFEYYCRHRIVMTPPHYHDGSGWWRNRYDLANRAKAVVVEDYNSVFGESYGIARDVVNNKTIDYLYDQQNTAYYNTIMSKEKIAKVLYNVLEGADT